MSFHFFFFFCPLIVSWTNFQSLFSETPHFRVWGAPIRYEAILTYQTFPVTWVSSFLESTLTFYTLSKHAGPINWCDCMKMICRKISSANKYSSLHTSFVLYVYLNYVDTTKSLNTYHKPLPHHSFPREFIAEGESNCEWEDLFS